MSTQKHLWDTTHHAGGRVHMRCKLCTAETNNAFLASIYQECPGPKAEEGGIFVAAMPPTKPDPEPEQVQVAAETALSMLLAKAVVSFLYALVFIVPWVIGLAEILKPLWHWFER